MIPVNVKKISFHPPSRSYAVMLKEIDGNRILPVIVGSFEAQAIALAIEYVETPRPLTHDLIGAVISGVDAQLKTIKISRLSEGVFYASMVIETDELGQCIIDARPSDALAVGLRLKVPILVHEEVMAEAGVPEGSIEEKPVKKTRMKMSVQEIEKKLEQAIEKEEYEKAAILRDKIKNMTA
ncbi:MAG: bifunctional nuclease family protein [Candidatus Marinimicrobia bacterium]|nr:bifunctional nuclease family protein [Candidatus Neomarinimicrobiota bacterium]